MKQNSLLKNLSYQTDKPKVEPLLETPFSKEIRITMKQNQVMKKHQTPFPIVVEIFEGKVDFGVGTEVFHLEKGDMLSLEGAVPHDLTALSDSIVRLTLSKHDKVERVKEVSQL